MEKLFSLFTMQVAKCSRYIRKIKQIDQIVADAGIDTLKYLKKGGWISATTVFFGEMLSIKPIVSVIDGKVEVIGKTKGNKKGNQYLISKVSEVGGINFDMPYGLLFSGNDHNNINKFANDCEYLFANINPNTYSLGCTIGTHIGPGAVGIAFFTK